MTSDFSKIAQAASPQKRQKMLVPLQAGFTLIELMLSLTVLTVLMILSAEVIGQVQRSWNTTNAKVMQFREARYAFDIITRNLSQATLNNYIDYDSSYLLRENPNADSAVGGEQAPSRYERRSDLHFICGNSVQLLGGDAQEFPGQALFFQAPLGDVENPQYSGLNNLLCSRGYFIQYGDNTDFIPRFLKGKRDPSFRYRLMEYSPPAEKNRIYSIGNGGDEGGNIGKGWFNDARGQLDVTETAVNRNLSRPISDNVIMLLFSPIAEPRAGGDEVQDGPNGPTRIAPQYFYDSSNGPQGSDTQQRHLLPPMVRVVMVALDEKSAERIESASTDPKTPPLGDLMVDLFQKANELDADLKLLGEELRKRKLNFRTFSLVVPLKSSKWSL
jgi:uncharacterized protein (TIGR02599 family)